MHLGAAIVAALLLNSSLVLQARDARDAPLDLSLRPGLIWYLMRRWRWWMGTLALVASALLQIYALGRQSVAVVQSLCAGGILIIPLYNFLFLRQRLGGRELFAIGLAAGGAALGAASIPDQSADLRFDYLPVFVAATVVSALALMLAKRFKSGIAMSLVAAIGMSAAALLQKVLALTTASGLGLAVAIGLLVLCGAIGFLAQMSALQAAPAVQVAPTILALSTVLPTFLAPALFGERWPHPVLSAAALLTSTAAATWLSMVVSPGLAAPEAQVPRAR
jgi:drug/metabolite transporter (DMT)-like permease